MMDNFDKLVNADVEFKEVKEGVYIASFTECMSDEDIENICLELLDENDI